MARIDRSLCREGKVESKIDAVTGACRPLLGVTMGDPAGIGPEIIVKAWSDPGIQSAARILVIGDPEVIKGALKWGRCETTVRAISSVHEAQFEQGVLDVLSACSEELTDIAVGQVQARAGRAAYESLVAAIDLAMAGDLDAIVTAPLNKAALNLAGFRFDGHTEILAKRTGARRVTMMLVGGDFRVTHVSTHCALREAIARVQTERILDVIRLTVDALRRMGISEPRIAVAGLNPHAGEGGLFGDEEINEIQPAIDRARLEGWDVYPNPLPPDTVFVMMAEQGRFDAVVAMYHDQGHIPAKLLHFADGVNVTLGLPIVRTSVDHGTAFDIAGRGIANASSMKAAILVALDLCGRGKRNSPSTL